MAQALPCPWLGCPLWACTVDGDGGRGAPALGYDVLGHTGVVGRV